MTKTIQMTIDGSLLEQVDQLVQSLNTTRSAFIRTALEQALKDYKIKQLEKQDAEGYRRHPAKFEESEFLMSEQVWGDEWNVEK